MDHFLFSGLLIGLMFGLPAGAVGALTVQRTLNYGIKAGLVTGLGSSAADCLYACIGAFGLTLISDFLFKYQNPINIVGGSLILVMGLGMIRRKNEESASKVLPLSRAKMFFSSFAVGITNPTAILTFLFAFSYFKISGQLTIFQGITLVCGVFIGTYIWWGILSMVTNVLKKNKINFCKWNKVFGVILTLLGTAVFARVLR